MCRHALLNRDLVWRQSGFDVLPFAAKDLRPSSVPLRVNDPLRFIVVVNEGKHPVILFLLQGSYFVNRGIGAHWMVSQERFADAIHAIEHGVHPKTVPGQRRLPR